jgi:uncharacterized membrane protein
MFPNLHPLLVHFPMALLLSSAAFSWLGLRWKDKGFDKAAWYTLLAGCSARWQHSSPA